MGSHPRLCRWLLAGPGAIAAALLFVMAMPLWLPAGAAGVDNVVYPMVLAPLVWAVTFTYACLEEDVFRGLAITLGMVVVCGILSGLGVAGAL
ncbi:MAG: hypothetical protein RLN99_16470 [Kiloniellaceae bacterium]